MVVVPFFHQVDEGQEVVDHDLVHRTKREERVQVVLPGDAFEVSAPDREPARDRVQPLPFAPQAARRWVEGEPADLPVETDFAQLARDGEVALHVARSDRAGDKQRPQDDCPE